MRRILRFAAYLWAAPNSLLGVIGGVVMLCLGAGLRLERGVAEFSGGWLGALACRAPAPLRFSAMTLGHVILGVSAAELAVAREHEHIHVRQYELWGPLFLPAYLASSAWQFAIGCRAYRDNFFEKQAYAAEASRARPCRS
jgi:hypothetical protein